jgi:hypothetical protein
MVMSKQLQSIEFDDQVYELNVSFSIRSEFLHSRIISDELGLDPTWSFSKGESYLSKSLNPLTKEIIQVERQYPWGVWGLDTRSKAIKRDVNEHLLYLLQILEPKQEKIEKYLLLADEYSIGFYIYCPFIGILTGGYEINSLLLSRVSRLSHFVDFSFQVLEQ